MAIRFNAPPQGLRLGVSFALALALCMPAACQTNHDDFKKTADASGNGGTGGHAGAGASAGAGNGGVDAGVDSGADSGLTEPPGPSVLTFMHGVVDAPTLEVCIAKLADGGGVEPFGAPLGGRQLAYGGSLALSSLAGADFASDTLVPLLLAGDLSLVATLTCAEAVALAEQTEQAFDASHAADDAGIGAAGAGSELDSGGTPDAGPGGGATRSALRVRSLPAIPAGTLSGERSYLLVASGCLGGLGFDTSGVEALCGDGYTPSTPTLFPVLVTISRLTEDGRVGMQVVHASRANDNVTVTLRSASGSGFDIPLVSGIREGQVAPKPPSFEHTASEYMPNAKLQLSASAQPDETIAEALASGGTAALVDGASYALVLLGPRFDYVSPPAPWNAPLASLIAAAPQP